MAFGPIIRFSVAERQVELAPFAKEDLKEFISPGMQQYGVLRYLGRSTRANVLEDEEDWFEKVRKDETSLVWGIWLIEGNTRQLIGNSGLDGITRGHVQFATSGSMIFRQELQGQGIGSAAHKARTWFAFHILGLHCVKSTVIQGNGRSRGALENSGYAWVYTERNEKFVEGEIRHLDYFECLNPSQLFWAQWWHGDRPSARQREARQQTREILQWAEANVTLP